MADSTLDSELFYLLPGRFGPAWDDKVPRGGFEGADHHNVADQMFPLGMVKQVYNTGQYGKAGYSEFVYLQTESTSYTTPFAKTVWVTDSATVWYTFTADPDDCGTTLTGNPLGVIGITADITDAYYAWFWCGGVCPEEYVANLAGNYSTDGNVAAGAIIAHNLATDMIGLGPAAGATEAIIGYALAADAE